MKKIIFIIILFINLTLAEAKYENLKTPNHNLNLSIQKSLKWTITKELRSQKPQEFIVKMKNGKSLKVDSIFQEKLSQNTFLLKTNSPTNLLQSLNQNDSIEYIQPNFKYKLTTNDEFFARQWSLSSMSWVDIGFEKLNKLLSWLNLRSVTVALIDDGVGYNHPDLKNAMRSWENCIDENNNYLWWCKFWYDFQNNDKDPISSTSSHWTHISGILSAKINNWIWIAWVTNNIKIMALKAGNWYLTTDSIIRSIYFAKNNWAKVINASFWSSPLDSAFPLTWNQDYLLYQAIKDFGESWWLFVTSAWNNSYNHDGWDESRRTYPCDFWVDTVFSGWTILSGLDNILCVAATDQNDNLAKFSDYGLQSVHIAAPWKMIFSTMLAEKILYENNFNTFSVIQTWSISWESLWWIKNIRSWDSVLLVDKSAPPYKNNSNTYFQFDLKNVNQNGLWLNFWWWCSAENSPTTWTDYIKVEWSVDWVNFKEISRFDYSSDDLYSQLTILWHNGYQWFFSYDISNFSGEDLLLRFSWISDESDNNYLWCAIDDISINWYDDGTDWNYWYLEWTSMSAPYVTAVAALWYAMSWIDYKKIKDSILTNSDFLTWLETKVKSARRLNSYNTILALMPSDISNIKIFSNTDFITWNYINSWDNLAVFWSWSVEKYFVSILNNDNLFFSWTINWTQISWINLLENGTYKIQIQGESSYWVRSKMVERIFIFDNIPPTSPTILSMPDEINNSFISIKWATWEDNLLNSWIVYNYSLFYNDLIVFSWSLLSTGIDYNLNFTWNYSFNVFAEDNAWNHSAISKLNFKYIEIDSNTWVVETILTGINAGSSTVQSRASGWSGGWVFFPALLQKSMKKSTKTIQYNPNIIEKKIIKYIDFTSGAQVRLLAFSGIDMQIKAEKLCNLIKQIIVRKKITKVEEVVDILNKLFEWIYYKNLNKNDFNKLVWDLKRLLKI